MATERVEIIITATGASAAATEIEGIGRAASSTASVLGFLRAALVAIAAADIAKRFLDMADTFTNASNKLQLVSNSAQEAADVYHVLADISNTTRTSIDQTANVYQKLAIAMAGTGTPVSQIMQVVENLNEALVISGTDSAHASAGLKELAESFGSGIVQSKQLRSILLDIPYLAVIMADKLHIASGELFHFAEAHPGTVTPQFMFQALLDYTDKLHTHFSRLSPTFAQVFEVFHNKLVTFLGDLNQTFGASTKLGQALDVVAAHFGQIAAALAAFGALIVANFAIGQLATFGTTLLGLIGLVTRLVNVFNLVLVPFTMFRVLAVSIGVVAVAPFQLLFTAITVLLHPVRALVSLFEILRVAVLTNPLFLVGTAVVAGLVAVFFLFHDQIQAVIDKLGGLSHIFNTVVNVAAAAVETIVASWRQVPAAFTEIGSQMGQNLVTGFQRAKALVMDVMKHPIDSLTMQPILNPTQVPAASSDPYAPLSASTPFNFYTGQGQTREDVVQDLTNQFHAKFDALQATGTNPVSEGVETAVTKVKALITSLDSMGVSGTKNFRDLKNEMDKFLHTFPPGTGDHAAPDLDKKIKGMLAKVSPLMAGTFKMQDLQTELGAKGVGEALSTASSGRLTSEDVLKRTERSLVGVGNATTDLSEKQQLLKKAFDDGSVSLSEYNAEATRLQLAYDNTQTTMSAGIDRTFLKMQQQSADTAAGVEKVFTSAFTSAEDALVQFVDTGKISFGSLAKTIEDTLLKSALNGLIGQFGGALFGSNAPGSKGFGTENASTVGSLFGIGGSIFGALGLGGGAGNAASNVVSTSDLGGLSGASSMGGSGGLLSGVGSWISSLFGFASGGSFEVGAASAMGNANGVDNRLVAFRARDGENVTVTQPGQVPGGVTVNQTFNTPDANSFRRSQGQIFGSTQAALGRAARRNRSS